MKRTLNFLVIFGLLLTACSVLGDNQPIINIDLENGTDSEPSPTATPLPPTVTLPPPTPEPSPETDALVEYSVPEIISTTEYQITESFIFQNSGENPATKLEIRVALIQDHEPYQSVLSLQTSPAEYTLTSDEYNNQYAVFTIENIQPGAEILIELVYDVRVNDVLFSWEDCQGEIIQEYLQADTFIESNDPEIIALAEQLSAATYTICEQAQAFYNYIGDNFMYLGYNPEDLGALSAIQQDGGDCSEFADAFIALSRASGIPARFVEGVTYNENPEVALEDVKHDWAEVYFPGIGWVPVDATWGRRPDLRQSYFASMSPDHIIITKGRNLEKLNGYHYMAYWYWWDGEKSTIIDFQESWSLELK